MLKRLAVLGLLSICAWCIPVRADTITDTTNGVIYTLTYSNTANPNVFDLQLVIDTTHYSKASTDKLADVALNIIGKGATVSDFTLTSSPAGFGQPAKGGLDAAGCNGKGSPYFCDPYTGAGLGLSVGAGDVYTFEWAYTGPLDDLMFNSHVKAGYLQGIGKNAGKSAGITSQDITLTESTPLSPVPEPSSLVLLGSGLAAVAFFLRRRLRFSDVRPLA